jgi:hypothetical protein
MLLLLIAATFVLSRKLNAAASYSFRVGQSSSVLVQARDALIGWSVNHPVAPGTLPYPDRNADPARYDDRSDCPAGATSRALALGRLPQRPDDAAACVQLLAGLGVDLRDASGEKLWYAVSPYVLSTLGAYRIINDATTTLPNQPNPNPNSWITVRNSRGQVLSNRVAFVVLSAGPPLNGQNRAGVAPAAQQFLDAVTIGGATYRNSDNDLDFIMYPDSRTTANPNDNFNDELYFVTIDELMTAVRARVLNVASSALRDFAVARDAETGPANDGYFPYAATMTPTYEPDIAQCVGRLPVDPPSYPVLRPAALDPYFPVLPLPNWFRRNRWEQYVTYNVGQASTIPPQVPCVGSPAPGTTTVSVGLAPMTRIISP